MKDERYSYNVSHLWFCCKIKDNFFFFKDTLSQDMGWNIGWPCISCEVWAGVELIAFLHVHTYINNHKVFFNSINFFMWVLGIELSF